MRRPAGSHQWACTAEVNHRLAAQPAKQWPAASAPVLSCRAASTTSSAASRRSGGPQQLPSEWNDDHKQGGAERLGLGTGDTTSLMTAPTSLPKDAHSWAWKLVAALSSSAKTSLPFTSKLWPAQYTTYEGLLSIAMALTTSSTFSASTPASRIAALSASSAPASTCNARSTTSGVPVWKSATAACNCKTIDVASFRKDAVAGKASLATTSRTPWKIRSWTSAMVSRLPVPSLVTNRGGASRVPEPSQLSDGDRAADTPSESTSAPSPAAVSTSSSGPCASDATAASHTSLLTGWGAFATRPPAAAVVIGTSRCARGSAQVLA
mmetsp:Transcript_3900/g.9955  ORF Transcript_3900/g.9955 Transcript_3900/m.9955 type:complete len:323 (+) Transcript_3900:83-1051(+)